MTSDQADSWDLFISHASEDKKDFVEPLAHALAKFGVSVWYDNYTLTVGDSLSRSIDKGLANSTHGLVVLSKSFLSKKWPEYELRGLTAREIVGGKVILPIWHQISYDDLVKFSPPLADKFAIVSSGLSPVQIAVKIISSIRPDIFSRIARRIAYHKAVESAKTVFIAPEKLLVADHRHADLPADLVGRVRLIRGALFEIYPQALEDWVDDFRRDTHPSTEVVIWERVAAVFIECGISFPELTPVQRKQVFKLICAHWFGNPETIVEESLRELPVGATEFVIESYESSVPLADRPPYRSLPDRPENAAGSDSQSRDIDREHFPNDLPEDLISQLMRSLRTQQN